MLNSIPKKLFFIGIYFLTFSTAFCQRIDTLDLFDFHNKPYTIKDFQLNQSLIDGVKEGVLQPYNALHSGFDKIEVQALLNRLTIPPYQNNYDEFGFINDDDWSCWCGESEDDEFFDEASPVEYYLGSDLNHIILNRNSNNEIVDLTLSLAPDHPLNINGIEVPMVKFKWEDVSTYLESNGDLNYHFIHNNDISVKMNKALTLGYYSTLSNDKPTDAYGKKLMSLVGSANYRLQYYERYDLLSGNIPGFSQPNSSITKYLIDLTKSGDINVYKPTFSSEKIRMSLEEFNDRMVLYEEEEFSDNFSISDYDGFSNNDVGNFVIKAEHSDLVFGISGELEIRKDNYIKTPKWITLIIPEYHSDNVRGIGVHVASYNYNEFLLAIKNGPENEWVNPMDVNHKLSFYNALIKNKLFFQGMSCEDIYGDGLFNFQREDVSRIFETYNECKTFDTTQIVSRDSKSPIINDYKNQIFSILKPYLFQPLEYGGNSKPQRNFTVSLDWNSNQNNSIDLNSFKKKALTYLVNTPTYDSLNLSQNDIDYLSQSARGIIIHEYHDLKFIDGKLKADNVNFTMSVSHNENYFDLNFSLKDFKSTKDKSFLKSWKAKELQTIEKSIVDHNLCNYKHSKAMYRENHDFVDFWFQPVLDYLNK